MLLARLSSRYAGTTWGRGDLALVNEYWWKTRREKQWRVAPDRPSKAPELIHEGSREDRYNDPGEPTTVRDANGFDRLQIAGDGQSIFLRGAGASPEGDRPFLDRFNLATKRKTRLFHSQAPYYESPSAVLDAEATRRLLHLLPMLVRTGQEKHIPAVEPLEARHGVGRDQLIGMADMRLAVWIGDGSGDVEGIAHVYLVSFRRLRCHGPDNGGAKGQPCCGDDKWGRTLLKHSRGFRNIRFAAAPRRSAPCRGLNC